MNTPNGSFREISITSAARIKRMRAIVVGTCGLGIVILGVAIGKVAMGNLSQKSEEPLNRSNQTTSVLVANKGIRIGTILNEADTAESFWPLDTLPKDAVTSLEPVKFMLAAVDIPAGSPVLRSQLMNPAGMFSTPLSPGNRAVTIEVDEITGVEGYASPGTRVDVVLTHHVDSKVTSQLIVQNARVLSYGGDTKTAALKEIVKPGSGRGEGRSITLDVTPEEGLKLITARQLGRISLLLRAEEDVDASPSVEVQASEIEGESAASKGTKGRCDGGTMRIGGEEFAVDCEGQIITETKR